MVCLPAEVRTVEDYTSRPNRQPQVEEGALWDLLELVLETRPGLPRREVDIIIPKSSSTSKHPPSILKRNPASGDVDADARLSSMRRTP